MTLLRPPDWTLAAACAGHPLGPAAFDQGTPEARAVCAACAVRLTCALTALGRAEGEGMWGGLDPDDRSNVAALFGYDRPGSPRHGERARYVAGCTDGPDGRACDLCREAHRRWAAERRAAGAWTTTGAATAAAKIPA